MPLDEYTRDFFKSVQKSLISIGGRLDRLIGIADRPRENDIQPEAPKNAPTEKDYAAVGKILFALNVAPPPTQKQQSEKGWYKTLDGWKKAFEIVGIVAAIFYALISYRQWLDLKHNFEVDERAWVGFTYSHVNIGNVGKSPQTSFTIKNTGHAPAFDVCPSTTLVRMDTPVTPEFPWKLIEEKMHKFSADGDCGVTLLTGESYERIRGYLADPPVRPDDRQNLVAGTFTVIFLGRVTYKDGFGTVHTTTYCRRMEAGYDGMPDRMFVCKLHETAD